MALKGKKKSRTRGSQARRRPASAPRPTYVGGREKPRWYQTTTGLVIGFIIAVAAIISVWAIVANSRSASQELADRQEALRLYTDELRTVTDTLGPVTTELATADTLNPEQLEAKTKDWAETLTAAQSQLSQSLPPAGMEPLNALAVQAVLLYTQAAEQYALLPELEGNAARQVSGKAAGSFQAANGIFVSIIQLIDTEREDAELEASGLTAPGSAPQQPGTIEVPTDDQGGVSDEIVIPGDDGGGGDQGGGGGDQGGDNGNG